MDLRTRRTLAVVSGILLVVGGVGLADPPGLFGFATPSCSPPSDCATNIAPLALSFVTALVGGVLGLVAIASATWNHVTRRQTE
jgi:hypothetical protein